MPPKTPLLGVLIDPITLQDLLAKIRAALAARERLRIHYVHVQGLNLAYEQPWLAEIFNAADVVYCDGVGVRLGAWLAGRPLPARFTLADWMGDLLRIAIEENAGVFFLGNPPGVAEKAGQVLTAAHPGLRIVGAQHGYFDRTPGSEENEAVVQQINTSGADLLLVGMGTPMQEVWVRDNLSKLHPSVVMTVGGVFEYFGGDLTRAPRWATGNGLEWLAILAQAPGRYWKRYLLGNPKFILRVLRERFG